MSLHFGIDDDRLSYLKQVFPIEVLETIKKYVFRLRLSVKDRQQICNLSKTILVL